jgi:predicted RNA-binding Zn ribbon-like protein
MGASHFTRDNVGRVTSDAPARVLPGEPAPVRLMNTIWADTKGVHDDLTTPIALREWLTVVNGSDWGPVIAVTVEELAEARLLRDSLRRLAAMCTHDRRAGAQSPVESPDEALAAVNTVVTHRSTPQLAIRGGRLQPGYVTPSSPTRAALAELANGSIELFTRPATPTLRACNAPGCVLYFVKSHPRREWCSEACGNRARAARHYQRNRGRNG